MMQRTAKAPVKAAIIFRSVENRLAAGTASALEMGKKWDAGARILTNRRGRASLFRVGSLDKGSGGG